jgi:uncharacterized membrane protein
MSQEPQRAADCADVRSTTPQQLIDMPGWRPILRQVLTRTVLISLLPMTVFYVTLSLAGVRAAALVTALLYYGALVSRIVRRKPVLAAALLAAGLLAVRTVVVFCTGSAFLYFLQPVAGTVAVATTFAATCIAGRPILERLAHDFCPITPELATHLNSARYFTWLSLVWTLSYGVNAIGTVWLLTTASLHGFIVMKAVLGPMLTLLAGTASYVLFVLAARQRNVEIRWANQDGWARAAA